MFYRNVGAPFWRGEGSLAIEVPKGHVFEPTPAELRQYGYKLEAVGEQPGVADQVVGPPPAPPTPLPPEWPITMRPDLYLQLHPDGVHAALARRICLDLGLPIPATNAPPPSPPSDTQQERRTRLPSFGKPKRERMGTEEPPHGPDD